MSEEHPEPQDASTIVGATASHAEVRRKVGEWDVRCTYFMGGANDPIEVTGRERGEMLGDLWCNSRFEADMLGSPLTGNASLGFDPVKKKYVATWKDSASPFLYTFEGELDDATGVFELEGSNFDPVRRCPANYRSRLEFLSNDEHILNLSIDVPDGEPIRVLRYHYTRKS